VVGADASQGGRSDEHRDGFEGLRRRSKGAFEAVARPGRVARSW
jgi:hypothetical protein